MFALASSSANISRFPCGLERPHVIRGKSIADSFPLIFRRVESHRSFVRSSREIAALFRFNAGAVSARIFRCDPRRRAGRELRRTQLFLRHRSSRSIIRFGTPQSPDIRNDGYPDEHRYSQRRNGLSLSFSRSLFLLSGSLFLRAIAWRQIPMISHVSRSHNTLRPQQRRVYSIAFY